MLKDFEKHMESIFIVYTKFPSDMDDKLIKSEMELTLKSIEEGKK
jgi:hypothetical protein